MLHQSMGNRVGVPPAGWYNTAEPPAAHDLRTHRHRTCQIYQACVGDAPDADFFPRVSPPLPWVRPYIKKCRKNTYFYFYYTFCRTYSQTHLFTAYAENSDWFLGRFTKMTVWRVLTRPASRQKSLTVTC